MASRIGTRSSNRISGIGINNKKNVLGLKSNNENNIMGLKDTTNIKGLKRKSDAENVIPPKKRSVLGDVTNALIEKTISSRNKEVNKFGFKKTTTTAVNKNVKKTNKENVTKTLSTTRGNLASVSLLPKQNVAPQKKLNQKSNMALVEEQQEDIDVALEECSALPVAVGVAGLTLGSAKKVLDSSSYVTASESSPLKEAPCKLVSISEEGIVTADLDESLDCIPDGVEDYDKECLMDPFAVSTYTKDIFHHYKAREKFFAIEKYMARQTALSVSMRTILVDWMVEVQESFELNHETLYLAVKLVDIYLCKKVIPKNQLQLVGCTAMFIACKFDERIPPFVDDFLYICDDAYKRQELINFEMKMLKVIGFDLGIPISYRYLRRYARCSKVSMEELTLARYILESSLMEYELIDAADHVVAAAALLVARYINAKPEERATYCWTASLRHYTGLELSDLLHIAHLLHAMLTRPPSDSLATVRNKYSHPVFYEVSKFPIPESFDL